MDSDTTLRELKVTYREALVNPTLINVEVLLEVVRQDVWNEDLFDATEPKSLDIGYLQQGCL